jgi:C4-dicarboxylate-specific signal transduction histidine kinase
MSKKTRKNNVKKKQPKRANQTAAAPGTEFIIQSQKMALVGQMAAGVAHEINTPLGTIALLAGELRSAFAEDRIEKTAAMEILRDIESASMRISQITHGLRAIARDSSKDPYVFANLREIVESTICLCQSRFANNGVELKIGKFKDSIEIECHPAQVGQIILNLLSNSFDAVQALPSKWIELEIKEESENILWVVTDSGQGISLPIREKIFQPFFTTKETGKGTGLGLSIVRSLVEEHGGTIYLNTKSKNTQFCVTLPKHRSF